MTRRFPRSFFPLAAGLLALALTTVGCDDEGGSQIPGGDVRDAPGGDGQVVSMSELRQVQPGPGEALAMFRGSDSQLVVGYFTPEGTPIGGATLSFNITESTDNCHLDPTPCLKLAAFSAVTDDSGEVSMTVSSGEMDTDSVIQVTVDGAGDAVAALNVLATVRAKDSYDLIVHFEYAGIRDFAAVKPLLFPSSVGSCAGVVAMPPLQSGNDLPTAARQTQDSPRDQSGNIADAIFTSLPNNEVFIAFGYAETDGGRVTVYGCTDEPPNEMNEMTVVLEEVPILLEGTYGLTSNFDLASGFPCTYDPCGDYTSSMTGFDFGDWETGDYIYFLLNFFQDPVGTLVSVLVPLVEDIGGISVPEALMPVITGVIEDTLGSVAPDWLNDAIVVGADVSDIITNFELTGELVVVAEPDENGILGAMNLHRYNGVSFKWRLPCVRNGGDPATCNEKTELTFAQLGQPLLAIEGEWTGSVGPCADNANAECLNIELHGLTVPYGEILLAIIEGYVLEQLFGAGVDSLEIFIQRVLLTWIIDWYNGDRPMNEQVDPAGGCTSIGTILGGLASGIGFESVASSIGEFACDQATGLLVDLVRDQAAALTVDTQDNLQLATPATASCRLYDSDGDLRYDMVGDASLPATRCTWEVLFRLDDTAMPIMLDGSFDAIRGN